MSPPGSPLPHIDMADPTVAEAVRSGDLAAVERFLASGRLNVNELGPRRAPDDDDEEAEDGVTYLYLAATRGFEAVVLALLRCGADPNLPTAWGGLPLFAAAGLGHEAVVLALLRAGVDPNWSPRNHRSVLYVAALAGHLPVVSTLLRFGANPVPDDHDGISPLHVASSRGHESVVSSLLQFGVDPNLATKGLKSTPLADAARFGHEAVVSTLLRSGAHPNRTDSTGSTPLHRGATVFAASTNKAVVSMLLRYGADPNVADQNGWTPLMVAIAHGQLSSISLLLTAGADPLPAMEFARTRASATFPVAAMLHEAEKTALRATKAAIERALGAHVPEFVQDVARYLCSPEVCDGPT